MGVRRMYQVKEVAALSGVSVRALHHYDAIGLLRPSRRSAAGYRLYTADDLLRLHQVLVGRELGLSLEEIRRSFEDPDFDPRATLQRQRAALCRRVEEAARMIQAVDRALALLDATARGSRDAAPRLVEALAKRGSSRKGEASMTAKDLFDGFEPARYETEAQERWGHTDAFRESMQRTQRYTPSDWQRLKEEQAAIYEAAVGLLKQRQQPGSAAAMDVAERHRASITRWFYECSYTMHLGLADLYESDSRFAENMDRYGAGLTQFLAAAIRANAARHGVGSASDEKTSAPNGS